MGSKLKPLRRQCFTGSETTTSTVLMWIFVVNYFLFPRYSILIDLLICIKKLLKTLKCNVINVINYIFSNYFSLKKLCNSQPMSQHKWYRKYWNVLKPYHLSTILLLFNIALTFQICNKLKAYASTSWPNSNEDMSFTNHFVWRYCIYWQISNILYVRRCGPQNTTNSNVRKFVSLKTSLFPLVQKYEKIKAI